MATITVTQNRYRRPRFRSLSLKISNSPFHLLPIEIFFLILEHAILHCKPRDLALVSRVFCPVLDTIIYRTVVLNSIETLQLFHRTTQSKKRIFLEDHVFKIAVTDHNVALHPYLTDIIIACSGLRSLVIPSSIWPHGILTKNPTLEKSLVSMTLQSSDPLNVANRYSTRLPTTDFSNLTHLRICEPGEVWCSPSDLVEAFGPLPHLSHLQFARRANANQANDESFALSISNLLAARPTLKVLVVSIFPGPVSAASSIAPVQESEIWHRMCELCCSDQRLILLPGRYEEWKDGWDEICAIRSGWHPLDFWLYARIISGAS